MQPPHEPRRIAIIIGSRKYRHRADLFAACDRLAGSCSAVWSGGAAGADRLAEQWARARGLLLRIWPADWRAHGRAAGKRRSADMLAAAPPSAVVLCFSPVCLSASPGSLFTVRRALALGLSVFLFDPLHAGRIARVPYE